jgi:hypothetical protein
MFKCTGRKRWRKDYQEKLKKHLTETHTAPALRKQILKAVKHWLENTPHEWKGQQERIGTFGLIRGYLAVELKEWQQKHIDKWSEKNQGTKRQHDTADAWAADLVSFMWTEAQELWMIRNNDTHQQPQIRKELETRVRKMYEEQELATARDRRIIFSKELQERLKDNDVQLEAWLDRFEEALEASKKAALEIATANTRRITDYFGTAGTT